MKKLLKLLPLLLLLPALSYGLYDDFSGYGSYFTVIDNCDSLTPGAGGAWAVFGSTVSITPATGKLGNGISFGKTDTTIRYAYIFGNNLYPTGINVDAIKDGYVTMWLSTPTITGGADHRVEELQIELTSTSTITNANRIFSTNLTNLSVNGVTAFKYLKTAVAPSGVGLPDYTSLKSAKINIKTVDAPTLLDGVIIDDLRVVGKNNTTNGIWNAGDPVGTGIWEIYTNGTDTMYAQLEETTVPTVPNMFSKTSYRDFVYSAKFKATSASTSTVGMYFRYREGLGDYSFTVTPHATTPILRINKTGTNTKTVTLTNTAFAFDTTFPYSGNSFWLKAEVNGGSIKAYYAPAPTSTTLATWVAVPGLTVSDSSPLAAGYAGVFGNNKYMVDDVLILPAPASPTANGGDGKVTLVWDTNYSYSGEIQSFKIYKSTSAAALTTGAAVFQTVNAPSYVYQDNAVVNGTTYFYKITSLVVKGSSTEEVPLELVPVISAAPHPGVIVSNNPFMPNSASAALNRIKFTVYNPLSNDAVLKVFRPTGALVKTINGTGTDLYWDGTNTSGAIVEGGIYVWQINVANAVAGSGTMVLAK